MMPEEESANDPLPELEQRIDTMQAMTDEELGTFGWLDWLVLIAIGLVLPVIALELVR